MSVFIVSSFVVKPMLVRLGNTPVTGT